jgi:hypothetical protein
MGHLRPIGSARNEHCAKECSWLKSFQKLRSIWKLPQDSLANLAACGPTLVTRPVSLALQPVLFQLGAWSEQRKIPEWVLLLS